MNFIEEIDLKSNDSQLQSIRRRNIDDKNSLIFVYPFIIDRGMEGQYAGILRDFFILQMTSQIKISNTLNIISTASDFNVDYNENKINPAERLRDLLGQGSPSIPSHTTIADVGKSYIDRMHTQSSKYEMQEKINSFLIFIKNQVENNPMFSDLRPMISSITVGNLLNIPLILGSKKFNFTQSALYWIMFICLAKNIKLNNRNNIRTIINTLKIIPTETYMKFFSTGNLNTSYLETPSNSKLNTIMNNTFTEVQKSLITLERMLDESKWTEEVGFGSNTVFATGTALTETQGIERELIRRAKSLFTSFVANDVLKLVQGLVHTVIGGAEIDISTRFTTLANNLENIVDEIFPSIINQIKAGMLNTDDETTVDAIINNVTGMCKDNETIGVTRIFNQIEELRFDLVDGSGELARFLQGLTLHTAQLATFSTTIKRNLISLSNDLPTAPRGMVTELSGLRERIYNLIKSFFEGFGPDSAFGNNSVVFNRTGNRRLYPNDKVTALSDMETIPILVGGNTVNVPNNLYNPLLDANGRPVTATTTPSRNFINFLSDRFDFLTRSNSLLGSDKRETIPNPCHDPLVLDPVTSTMVRASTLHAGLSVGSGCVDRDSPRIPNPNYNPSGNIEEHLSNGYNSITELVQFMALYSLFSYFCEYMKEIEANVKVQKRDALDFPNYCIVIPMYMLKGLYGALAAKNFEDAINNNANEAHVFKLSSIDTKGIIKQICNRLGLPNFFVIDKTDIYYKLSFMTDVNKLSLQTLTNYTNSQKNILQGF